MEVTLNFIVEGMSGEWSSCETARAAVLRSLHQAGMAAASFDPTMGIFSVSYDPLRNSWQEVRRAVNQAGRRLGEEWLAVVMSP